MQLEKCSDQAVSSAHDKPTSTYTFLASNCTASNRWRSRISRSSKIKKHRRQVTTSAYMNTNPDSVLQLSFSLSWLNIHICIIWIILVHYFPVKMICIRSIHGEYVRIRRYIYVHINNKNLHIFLSILNTYIFHRKAILITWIDTW